MSYDLCEDVIFEIFTRLPTKSLLQFRSASKSWYACIGSPGFIHLHTVRSPPNKVMITHQLHHASPDYITYTLHSRSQLSCAPYIGVKYPFRYHAIVGSCNGIVCLHSLNSSIHLWNPSIRCKVTVCGRPSWSDPKGRRCVLGFGFDAVVGDYKIVMSTKYNTEKRVVKSAFVYTLKADTWREIAFPIKFSYRCSCQCLFDGALHWAIKRCSFGGHHQSYLLSFDLSSEVFSKVELPEPSWKGNKVAIINGSLAVISSKRDDCRIWVRNFAAASWSVAFKLKTHEFQGAQRVFQRTANDDLLFDPFLSGITVYYPEARAGTVGLSGSCQVRLMTPCIDSLELLDIGTSCDQGTGTSET